MPEEADFVIESSATAEETAAVTAVVSRALAEVSANTIESDSGPSRWQRSQRSLRKPLPFGRGSWDSWGSPGSPGSS